MVMTMLTSRADLAHLWKPHSACWGAAAAQLPSEQKEVRDLGIMTGRI